MKSAATDSPWFWAYVFGVAALVALALAAPKFGPRQAQIEREFQGRQRAAQNLAGQEPSEPMSSPEDTVIGLRPLFLGLAAISIVAWLVYWRTHVARQSEKVDSPDPTPPHSGIAP